VIDEIDLTGDLGSTTYRSRMCWESLKSCINSLRVCVTKQRFVRFSSISVAALMCDVINVSSLLLDTFICGLASASAKARVVGAVVW